MLRIVLAIQPDHLNDAHLQRLVQRPDRIVDVKDIFHRLGHRTMSQKHESIALTRRVGFCSEEGKHELGSIGYKVLKFAVDGIEGEDRVFANIRMSMFQTRAASGYEGFEEFLVLRYLLEEPQAGATDIFVGVLLVRGQSAV